jgi:hypothetical protein
LGLSPSVVSKTIGSAAFKVMLGEENIIMIKAKDKGSPAKFILSAESI